MLTWAAAWVWNVVPTTRLAIVSTPPQTHIAQAEQASNAMTDLSDYKDFLPAVVALCGCQFRWVSDHADHVGRENNPGLS